MSTRADAKGNISHVKIEGNERFTTVKTAVAMADRGELANAHSVRRKASIHSFGLIPMGVNQITSMTWLETHKAQPGPRIHRGGRAFRDVTQSASPNEVVCIYCEGASAPSSATLGRPRYLSLLLDLHSEEGRSRQLGA